MLSEFISQLAELASMLKATFPSYYLLEGSISFLNNVHFKFACLYLSNQFRILTFLEIVKFCKIPKLKYIYFISSVRKLLIAPNYLHLWSQSKSQSYMTFLVFMRCETQQNKQTKAKHFGGV